MRRPRLSGLFSCLLCLLAFPAYAKTHEATALVGGFVAAWNAHDPRALDAVLAEDADWVTATGQRIAGRERIQSFLAGEHATWARSSRMTASNRTLRAISADVAVIHFDWEITGAVDRQGKTAVFLGVNSFVAHKGPAGWRVVAGQVTNARPSADGLPAPGSYGFNWLDPEAARCRKLTASDLAPISKCTLSTNAFGIELPSHACRVDAKIELMVYRTAAQCQQALETMQANGP
jgi:uncharacterized protein (TIGR02246 family)